MFYHDKQELTLMTGIEELGNDEGEELFWEFFRGSFILFGSFWLFKVLFLDSLSLASTISPLGFIWINPLDETMVEFLIVWFSSSFSSSSNGLKYLLVFLFWLIASLVSNFSFKTGACDFFFTSLFNLLGSIFISVLDLDFTFFFDIFLEDFGSKWSQILNK